MMVVVTVVIELTLFCIIGNYFIVYHCHNHHVESTLLYACVLVCVCVCVNAWEWIHTHTHKRKTNTRIHQRNEKRWRTKRNEWAKYILMWSMFYYNHRDCASKKLGQNETDLKEVDTPEHIGHDSSSIAIGNTCLLSLLLSSTSLSHLESTILTLFCMCVWRLSVSLCSRCHRLCLLCGQHIPVFTLHDFVGHPSSIQSYFLIFFFCFSRFFSRFFFLSVHSIQVWSLSTFFLFSILVSFIRNFSFCVFRWHQHNPFKNFHHHQHSSLFIVIWYC